MSGWLADEIQAIFEIFKIKIIDFSLCLTLRTALLQQYQLMHLSKFFQLKPSCKVGFQLEVRKIWIPYIPYRSLLLSTTVLND